MTKTKQNNNLMKVLLILVTLCTSMCIMSSTAFASDDMRLDLGQYAGKEIYIYSDGYAVDGGDKISHSGSYTLTGSTNNCSVTIKSGNHHITLDNVNINRGKPYTWGHHGIKIEGGSANLTLVGNNTITAGDREGSASPIYVTKNTTLTIGGEGSLTTNSTTDGKASIGAAWDCPNGTINITGGDH